jgi:hypothetical protein
MDGSEKPGSGPETETTRGGHAASPDADSRDAADRQVRLAVLEAENRQLREEYARARQSTYRRTAIGLVAVGLVALVGGLGFPDARTVLFALGGTGVFAGVLTAVLTPERFISARVGARVLRALRADREAMIDELGLHGNPVYVPADGVRLFVPRRQNRPLPGAADLTDTFVVPADADRGGVSFHPTGEPLFEELETVHDRPIDATPRTTASVVADALVEIFELADGTAYDVDSETNRVTFEIDGTGLGDPTGMDHPVPSLIAVALVRTLETPVRVEITGDDPLTVTCRYDPRSDAATAEATADAAPDDVDGDDADADEAVNGSETTV